MVKYLVNISKKIRRIHMLEIPEALTIANQINQTIRGKQIVKAVADYSPHKFAWYHGDPQEYPKLLEGKTIECAKAQGGMVEIKVGSVTLLLGEGVAFRYYEQSKKPPVKHQLLLEFEDSSFACASIQMYGGIWCFSDEGEFQNPYYKMAKEKPSPMSEDFDKTYFDNMISLHSEKKLSVKAFLATEQKIPGLGNGALQDILWRAKLHPKTKLSSLSQEQKLILFDQIKAVLSEMRDLRGRDTEKDLFGNSGGYKTVMSKNNVGESCPECGGTIKKENYMGGSIYYCETCQVL
jgi:formamidopyrimidine-DNA glycosylase